MNRERRTPRRAAAKPIGPALHRAHGTQPTGLTREIRLTDDTAAVTVRGPEDAVTEDAAADYLRAQGHDPAGWRVTGLRSSEWTMPGGKTGVSTKYTFARTSPAAERPPLDELFAEIRRHDPPRSARTATTASILLGDMQFGKIDGDGVDGTLARTIDVPRPGRRPARRVPQAVRHRPRPHRVAR